MILLGPELTLEFFSPFLTIIFNESNKKILMFRIKAKPNLSFYTTTLMEFEHFLCGNILDTPQM
jgi:hypothetical protein